MSSRSWRRGGASRSSRGARASTTGARLVGAMLWSGRPGGGSWGLTSTLRPGSPVRSSSTSNSSTSSSGFAVAAYRPHMDVRLLTRAPSNYRRDFTSVQQELTGRTPDDLGATRRPPHARRDVRRRRARPAQAPGHQGRHGPAPRREARARHRPARRHRAAGPSQRCRDGRRRSTARTGPAPPPGVDRPRRDPRAHHRCGTLLLERAGPEGAGPAEGPVLQERQPARRPAHRRRRHRGQAGARLPGAHGQRQRAPQRPARPAARRDTWRTRRPARPS